MSKKRDYGDAGWLFDLGGASALAGAVGFAYFELGPIQYQPSGAAVIASLAFLATYFGLRCIGSDQTALSMMKFRVSDLAIEPEADALVLDDILKSMDPDSRVVRLFEPEQAPTAGQLQAQIDQHIGTAPDADAADALHEALANIRRSLK